jgi:hypothetical protein
MPTNRNTVVSGDTAQDNHWNSIRRGRDANPRAEGIVARQAELLEARVDSPIFAPKA